MKKWQEYSRQEKGMILVIGMLFIAVLLSLGRVKQGTQRGMQLFFHTPADTTLPK